MSRDVVFGAAIVGFVVVEHLVILGRIGSDPVFVAGPRPVVKFAANPEEFEARAEGGWLKCPDDHFDSPCM
jgi:hypothetical protein